MGEEDIEEDDDYLDYIGLEDCVKVVVSKSDPSTIFCLDKLGKLPTICPATLIRFFTWASDNKEDFVILKDEGSSEVKFLVLSKDLVKEESYLQTLEFPSFTTAYRLAVSWFSRLVVAPLNQNTPLLWRLR